mgnify:CR=1 FL=1
MAKVLIDISEEELKRMRANTNKSSSDFVILNGTPLDGLTNGEIIQKAFQKAKILYIDEWEDYNNSHSLYKKAWVKVDFGYGEVLGLSLDWWNAKWG